MIQDEIESLEDRLARKTFLRKATLWAFWGGLAVLLAGFIPIDGSVHTSEPDYHAAYERVLEMGRAARQPDGSISVQVDRSGSTLKLTIPTVDVFTPGTDEERRFVVSEMGQVSDEDRESMRIAVERGWVISSIDPASVLHKTGLAVGDVITRVGSMELPVARRVTWETPGHPHGEDSLKVVGGAIAALGFALHRLRSARLRVLRAKRAVLEREVDAAL